MSTAKELGDMPAYPVNPESCPEGSPVAFAHGMTLRQRFAMAAMQGMLAYPGDDQRGSLHNNSTPQGVACLAFEYADAMLAESIKE